MMYKEEKRLFGKAILQALKEKYQEELDACDFTAECSEAHKKAMEKIIADFDAKEKHKKKIRLIALLVAAALFLTGCAVYVYRDAIREFVEHIYETYIMVDFDSEDKNQNSVNSIEEVYTLTYVPEGYELVQELKTNVIVTYRWENDNGDSLIFEQLILDSSKFILDVEHGETIEVLGNDKIVYHRVIESSHCYIWNDSKYSMTIKSSVELEREDLINIFNNISQ